MTRNTRARRWCISMLAPSLSVAASAHGRTTSRSNAPTLQDIDESWSLRSSCLDPRSKHTRGDRDIEEPLENRLLEKYECDRIRATGGGTTRSSVCISEMACDADYEYVGACGSVSAVEDRINSVVID